MSTFAERIFTRIRNLDGPAAFDSYSFLLFSIASVWVTLVVDFGQSGKNLSSWLVAGFVSLGCALIWLLCAKFLLKKIQGYQFAYLFILLAYALTGAIRFFTLTAACDFLKLDFGDNRLFVSVITTVVLLSFANATSAQRIAFTSIHRVLSLERQKLVWLSAKYDEKVLNARRELDRDLEREVFPSLATAVSKLDGIGTERSDAISQYLSKTVAEVVRPTSERLSRAADTIIEELELVVASPPEADKAKADYSIREALKPWLTVGILLVLGFAVSPALGQNSRFIVNAMTSAIALLALLALKKYWPSKLDAMHHAPAVVSLAAIYLLVFTGAQSVLLGGATYAPVQLIQITFNVGGSMILAVMALSEQKRNSIDLQYREQIQALEKLISRLRKQIWITRRNAAWVLHGPIQSALISSALSLNEPGLTRQDRTDLQQRISDAVESLKKKNETMNPDIADALNAIANVWARSCATNWSADIDLLDQIQRDHDSSFCVIEIVREAVGNAVRHGKATQVEVAVLESEPGVLEIGVKDNGAGITEESIAGLGSAMLDQISLSWKRENHPPGCQLTVFVVREREAA